MTREWVTAVLRCYRRVDVYDATRAMLTGATLTYFLQAPVPAATRTVDAMGRKPSEAPERAEEAP